MQPSDTLQPGPGRGVVYLGALDISDPTAQERICGEALAMLRSAAAADAPPRFWLVTAGTQSGMTPAQATLWGLARTVRIERPELWGGLVDLDPGSSAAERAACANMVADRDSDGRGR